MAEIISQEEIDALLNALDVVEGPRDVVIPKGTRRIKEYDFKRPDKFSKDQIRTLHMMMEGFARSWSTLLSGKLRSLVHVEIISVDQLPYEEFIKSTFNPTVISVISMEPLEGSAILDISPPVAFAIIDRLVGGTGRTMMAVRELTEIEEALIGNVVGDALKILKNAMGDLIQVNPMLEGIEYNPQFTQVVPPGDMTLFISFEMRIEDSRGMLGLCLPHILLEPILGALSTERFFRRANTPEEEAVDRSIQVLRTLGPSPLDIRVEIGSVELSISQILDLAPGDIIKLSSRISDLFRIYVGDDPYPRFLARPGKIGRFMGIEIMEFYEE
ncbi:MAG: flagellar motor switch protein FliM [bacterium]|nr:flagellar motor switch protein FliM [bacterium]